VVRARFLLPAAIVWTAAALAWSPSASAATGDGSCGLVVTADNTVTTAAQRRAAGKIAQPPLTDQADGFAWPDTPMGVVRDGAGYAFFASDGGSHARQQWHGNWYGNGKYGSVTRTLGTLADPLGSAPPIDVTIAPNPDPGVNPDYESYGYMGGGPVYRVPQGKVGAGNLLMVYHAEIDTTTTQSFYSVYGLASSTDDGLDWTDLGEIVRVNQAYRARLDGYDIGDAPLVVSPDGKYLYVYFADWLANGTTHWGNTITRASVARAPIDSVTADAFGEVIPHAARFQKYYEGSWDREPGIGGYSTDLDPQAGYSGELQVAVDPGAGGYMMIIDEGVVLAYSESVDGLTWSLPVLFYDFRQDKDQPRTYAMPVGADGDPRVLGPTFYVYYTRYPNAGPQPGWAGATVHRLTVQCS
jgi:hypothetical protein